MSDVDLSYAVEDRIGVLTVDRPPVNAVRYEDVGALSDLLSDLPEGDELVVVLTSAGDRAFMAGHDVTEFVNADHDEHVSGSEVYMEFARTLYELPLPSIAAVDGPALGTGMVVTSLCDLRVASPDAAFGLPEINVGVIGGFPPARRAMPESVARHLMYTGEPISGERAYDLGYASVLSETPVEAAMDCARTIAAKSPDGVRAARRIAIETQPDWPIEDFRIEREEAEALLERPNSKEAASAFIDGREPRFDG